MSTITKLSPDVAQYYKNITSLIGAIARCTCMNSTKGVHEFTKGKLERCTGGLKG